MPHPSSLPVLDRTEFDNSIIETVARCPRKAYYSYWLNRASIYKSYAIAWGNACHRFIELVNQAYIDDGRPEDFESWLSSSNIIASSTEEAMSTYWPSDPPIGHKDEWRTSVRLLATFKTMMEHWRTERSLGARTVLHTEQAFTLRLPSGRIYGGKIDEVLEDRNSLWLRDYKTTSRMGRTYGRKFDPNNQMSGYLWAVEKLSGRRPKGVIIQTVYNTKTRGPEVHEHLSTRTPGQIQQWLDSIEKELDTIEDYVSSGVWPQRTLACDDFGGCQYREACQLSSWHHIDRWLQDETIESVWDFTNPDIEEPGDVG